MSRTFTEIVEAAGFPELVECAPTLDHVIAARATIDNIRRKALKQSGLRLEKEHYLTVALRELDTLMQQMASAERG